MVQPESSRWPSVLINMILSVLLVILDVVYCFDQHMPQHWGIPLPVGLINCVTAVLSSAVFVLVMQPQDPKFDQDYAIRCRRDVIKKVFKNKPESWNLKKRKKNTYTGQIYNNNNNHDMNAQWEVSNLSLRQLYLGWEVLLLSNCEVVGYHLILHSI